MRLQEQVAIIIGVSHAGQAGYALTVTFARAGKPWGISVNALGPGTIVTQANLDAMHPSPEEVREQWVSLEQLIEAALFLVTPVGDGVNGVVLPVQGKGI